MLLITENPCKYAFFTFKVPTTTPRRDEKGIVTMGLKQFLTDEHAIETA